MELCSDSMLRDGGSLLGYTDVFYALIIYIVLTFQSFLLANLAKPNSDYSKHHLLLCV